MDSYIYFNFTTFFSYISIYFLFYWYRSAGFIWEYSLYLSALPIITSATGLTSWMFAVEGSAANLYLLALAYAFKKEQSNANARKVFLCSLWYLPLLLGAYIFHSKVWNESMHTDDMVSYKECVYLHVFMCVYLCVSVCLCVCMSVCVRVRL